MEFWVAIARLLIVLVVIMIVGVVGMAFVIGVKETVLDFKEKRGQRRRQ
jgi:hypothetical protein